MKRQLKGFGWWVLAVLVAAVATLVTGGAALPVVAAAAGIAIGAAGATIMIYCYSSCT